MRTIAQKDFQEVRRRIANKGIEITPDELSEVLRVCNPGVPMVIDAEEQSLMDGLSMLDMDDEIDKCLEDLADALAAYWNTHAVDLCSDFRNPHLPLRG